MFGNSPFELGAALVFTTMLACAAVSDIRVREIPNSLVAVTAVFGVAYAGMHSAWGGALLLSIAGMALGLAIWLPCYTLRMLGAGDVKFFAAASTWLTPQFVMHAAALSAVFGGMLALGWVIWRRSFGSTIVAGSQRAELPVGTPAVVHRNLDRRLALPYGVAMSAGLGVIAWFPNIFR